MGLLISALAQLVDLLLTLFMWIVIARALVSWVSPDPFNPIVRFLVRATEPLLGRLRRRLPFLVPGGLDLTPVIVIFGIIVLRTILVGSLYQWARRF